MGQAHSFGHDLMDVIESESIALVDTLGEELPVGTVAKCAMRRQYSSKKSSLTHGKLRFFRLEILA